MPADDQEGDAAGLAEAAESWWLLAAACAGARRYFCCSAYSTKAWLACEALAAFSSCAAAASLLAKPYAEAFLLSGPDLATKVHGEEEGEGNAKGCWLASPEQGSC